MPRDSISPRRIFGLSWFDVVPAYRLASLRVLLAVITIVLHVPKFNRFIDAYTASSFHPLPAFSWIPFLTRTGGVALMVSQHLAAWGLLLGVAPHVCAWFLAAAGFYVMSLDPEFYAHNAHFHLTLLALIGCATDRVPLWKLLADRSAVIRCPAWPEHLIRLQLVIVFFYAAVDKVFSPYWGVSGALLATQRLGAHGPGLAVVQRMNEMLLPRIAGGLSAATIAVEFFLATGFLVRILWPIAVVVAALFVLYLEFILRPGVFAWDVLGALLVFAPAGDRAWEIAYSPTCHSCRWNRALLSRLDWLRRLQWVSITTEGLPVPPRQGGPTGFHLISPGGRTVSGFDAFRLLPFLLPAPLLVVTVVARFGGGFLASRGYGPWDDLPFLILGGLIGLWVPGMARYIGRPIFAVAARMSHHWLRGN